MGTIGTWLEKTKEKWNQGKFVCVGLDSEYAKIPEGVRAGRTVGAAMIQFNSEIIEATHRGAGHYKPNLAFFLSHGAEGITALQATVREVRRVDPTMPVILDLKSGDIGNTSEAYAAFAFDHIGADAVTLSPYLGKDALLPFLKRADRGCIILCRTSNPGGGEFQDLATDASRTDPNPLFERVARHVALSWNTANNCALVVGATKPEEAKRIREIVPELPFLLPGIGAQGGDLEAAVKNSVDAKKQGIIVNSSRGIIFASKGADFAAAAARETLKLNEAICAVIAQMS